VAGSPHGAAQYGAGAESVAAAITATARDAIRRPHPASLSTSERHDILEILCSPRCVDLSTREVFMTLLDESRYHYSVRSMYRLLAASTVSAAAAATRIRARTAFPSSRRAARTWRGRGTSSAMRHREAVRW
jgi:hypothetical protein